MAKLTKEIVDEGLHDWYSLQDALRCCTEDEAEQYMKAEERGKARERFMKRIHSRLNRLRALRERAELGEKARVA